MKSENLIFLWKNSFKRTPPDGMDENRSGRFGAERRSRFSSIQRRQKKRNQQSFVFLIDRNCFRFVFRCVDWWSQKFCHNQRYPNAFNASRNGVRLSTEEKSKTFFKLHLGTVADICRYLRNFNGVLQIMAAFVNSSVYRLKQTWDRISKQNKQVINKLQSLVHSDGKFKNLRDTLTK